MKPIRIFFDMYYVYRHVRLDKNEVFYVGKGKTKVRNGKIYRCDEYCRAYDKRNRNRFWINVTKKTTYRVDILLDNMTQDEANNKEMELIQLYGRRDLGKGTLVNLTNGGEKEAERVFSAEYRMKLSIAATGRIKSIDTRKKLSDSLKGKKKSDDHKIKLSESKLGKRMPQHVYDKGARSRTGLKRSIETKKKMSESMIRYHKTNPSPVARKVINKKDKCVYESVASLSRHLGVSYDYIFNRLKGRVKNKTDYVFLDEFQEK